MSAKLKLNVKYSELCQKLGHLNFKKACLELEISQTVSKIQKLNELQPEIIEALEGSAHERKSTVSSPSNRTHFNESSGVSEAVEPDTKNSL
jgi:hypothetical protein